MTRKIDEGEGEGGVSEYLCGVWRFRPKWLQWFANSRCYALCFAALGIFQGSYRAYLIATVSTIEKRFSMSGGETGIIMIGDDISPLISCVAVMFFMRNSSKPTWIGAAMLFSVLSCLCSVLPYMIYGPANLSSALTSKDSTQSTSNDFQQLCDDTAPLLNATEQCKNKTARSGSTSLWPLISFFMGNFLNGLGGSTYYMLGTIYMDDNVKKKNSALYFGGVYTMRLFGPVVGYGLAWITLSKSESLSAIGLDIGPTHPSWIGAWWLGYIVIGTGLFLTSLPMFLFPKKIRSKSEANAPTEIDAEDKVPLLKQIKDSLIVAVRVIKNPIFTFRTIGNILMYIAIAGYYVTFPKYIEHQFQQSASRASLLTGPTYVLSNMVGIMIGAIVIQVFRPRPRYIATYVCVGSLITGICFLATMVIDCPTLKSSIGPTSGFTPCLENCQCLTDYHSPVCDTLTKTQYFSPCFAGCSEMGPNHTYFAKCSCVTEPATVKSGACFGDCSSTLMLFTIIMFSIQVLKSSTYVGSNLILLRCLEPKDKSVALSILSAVMNVCAFIPYPLIYGAISDAACLIWEKKCTGKTGTCWVYDLPNFRQVLHVTTFAFCVIGALFHGGAAYYSNRIENFYDGDDVDHSKTRQVEEERRKMLENKSATPEKPFFVNNTLNNE